LSLEIHLSPGVGKVYRQQRVGESLHSEWRGSLLIFFFHLFTCAYIVWVISPPCPPPPPFPLPHSSPSPPSFPPPHPYLLLSSRRAPRALAVRCARQRKWKMLPGEHGQAKDKICTKTDTWGLSSNMADLDLTTLQKIQSTLNLSQLRAP
jgi:hypothetical protein